MKIRKKSYKSVKHCILNKGHFIIKDEILNMAYKAKGVVTLECVGLSV